MKTFFLMRYPLIATAIFVGIILIAHFFVSDGYSIFTNTISDLGAQQYTHAWVMRLGFFLFGGITILGVLLNGISLRTAPIFLYGGAIFMRGFSRKHRFSRRLPSIHEKRVFILFSRRSQEFLFLWGFCSRFFMRKQKPRSFLMCSFFLE